MGRNTSCSGNNCECLWELDYRPLGMDGSRRRVRFKTRKQAELFRAQTTEKAAHGEYVPPAEISKFVEVAEDWFQSKTDRRPSHVSDLRTRLDRHILPVFGPHKLDRIRVASTEKFRNNLRDQKYARRTIKCILRIVGSVFRLAIRRGLCSKNPVDSVERAKQVSVELKAGEVEADTETVDPDSVLSPQEIQVLPAAANSGFERMLIEIAYLTGARHGELLHCVGAISNCRRKELARWSSAAAFHGPGLRAKKLALATFRRRPRQGGERFQFRPCSLPI
jgi:hypothetical protein